MDIKQYKEKISELEKRQQKVEKEYDRQQVLYGQLLQKLKEMDIETPEEIDDKVAEMEANIATRTEKLDKYLAQFESKLKSIEEMM